MMLDDGYPISVTVLEGQECRAVALDELRRLAAGSERLAALLAKHQDEDTILWYASPDAAWAANMGIERYALCRNRFVVDDVMVRMN